MDRRSSLYYCRIPLKRLFFNIKRVSVAGSVKNTERSTSHGWKQRNHDRTNGYGLLLQGECCSLRNVSGEVVTRC